MQKVSNMTHYKGSCMRVIVLLGLGFHCLIPAVLKDRGCHPHGAHKMRNHVHVARIFFDKKKQNSTHDFSQKNPTDSSAQTFFDQGLCFSLLRCYLHYR